MKNNAVLLFFFLTLNGQMLFSQKALPSGAAPYMANWSYTLKNAMLRAGFDLPDQSAPQHATGIRQRNALQLDSTTTFHAYDLNGAGDSTPLVHTVYRYPASDVKIETNYQFENGAWQTINQTVYISDEQQRLVDVWSDVYDPESESFKPNSKLVIFPHGNSPDLLDSLFAYSWDENIMDWHLILINQNTFDNQDRLQVSSSMFDYIGGLVTFNEEYSYDTNGDNYLIEAFGIMDGVEFPTGRTESIYVDHRPTVVTDFINDGVNFFPDEQTQYFYTLFGSALKEMYFKWDYANDDWRLTQTIDYEYDNEQRVAGVETVRIQQNGSQEREHISYAYVQDENLYLETVFIWDVNLMDWKLKIRKYYYYTSSTSVDPFPHPVKTLAAWPNPATGSVRLNLETETTLLLMDGTGKLIQSRQLQPGQQLDLTAYPAGVYTISVQQGMDLYRGKVVKQ